MFHKIIFIHKKKKVCLTQKKLINLFTNIFFINFYFLFFWLKVRTKEKNCSKMCVDRGTVGPEDARLTGVDEVSGGFCWKSLSF